MKLEMLITHKTSEREPGHWRIVEGETNDSSLKDCSVMTLTLERGCARV